jgi:hypothetical protein
MPLPEAKYRSTLPPLPPHRWPTTSVSFHHRHLARHCSLVTVVPHAKTNSGSGHRRVLGGHAATPPRGDRTGWNAEHVLTRAGQADSAFGLGHHNPASGRIAAHNYSFVFHFPFRILNFKKSIKLPKFA